MLHNLLPKTQKKQLRNDYLIRLAGVTLFLLAGAVTTGAIALVPSYISLTSAISEFNEGQLALEGVQEEKPLTILSQTARALTVLRDNVEAEPMTDLLTPIVDARPEGIQITSITFNRDTFSFSLKGIADTRDTLVAYRRAVEALERAIEVSSPIENLARNTNLEFTLSVLLEKPDTK